MADNAKLRMDIFKVVLTPDKHLYIIRYPDNKKVQACTLIPQTGEQGTWYEIAHNVEGIDHLEAKEDDEGEEDGPLLAEITLKDGAILTLEVSGDVISVSGAKRGD